MARTRTTARGRGGDSRARGQGRAQAHGHGRGRGRGRSRSARLHTESSAASSAKSNVSAASFQAADIVLAPEDVAAFLEFKKTKYEQWQQLRQSNGRDAPIRPPLTDDNMHIPPPEAVEQLQSLGTLLHSNAHWTTHHVLVMSGKHVGLYERLEPSGEVVNRCDLSAIRGFGPHFISVCLAHGIANIRALVRRIMYFNDEDQVPFVKQLLRNPRAQQAVGDFQPVRVSGRVQWRRYTAREVNYTAYTGLVQLLTERLNSERLRKRITPEPGKVLADYYDDVLDDMEEEYISMVQRLEAEAPQRCDGRDGFVQAYPNETAVKVDRRGNGPIEMGEVRASAPRPDRCEITSPRRRHTRVELPVSRTLVNSALVSEGENTVSTSAGAIASGQSAEMRPERPAEMHLFRNSHPRNTTLKRVANTLLQRMDDVERKCQAQLTEPSLNTAITEQESPHLSPPPSKKKPKPPRKPRANTRTSQYSRKPRLTK